MLAVGTAEGIGGKFLLDGLEISLGDHHVGVQEYQVLALRPGSAVVSRRAGTGVFLVEIFQSQTARIFLHDVLATLRAAVLDYYDFKIRKQLFCKALQQLVHFGGTVIHWDYEAVFHFLRVLRHTSSGILS